jgi:glutamine synthetase
MALEKLLKLAKENKVEFIDLKLCDLAGSWHHVTLPLSSLKRSLFESGVGVDGSSLGFSRIESGDMIMVPDPTTAFIEPFFERSTLSMIGDIMNVGSKVVPSPLNPRRVARDAEIYLRKIVKGAKSMIGPEFEFYIFDRVNFYQGPDIAFYRVDAEEGKQDTLEDEESLGYRIPYKRGYYAAPPFDRTHNLRSCICAMLTQAGIELKYHHHEVGGAGQQEIEVAFDSLFSMADKTMLIKYIVKNECFRQGKSATFMPKPLFNEPGSGMHVHQYLADAKGSLFHDSRGKIKFSKMGLHYIGGLLKHADSVLAFTNPSTNSYKRLVPGFEAPVAGTYAVGNRTSCIRIPGYQRDPRTMRLEFRPSDATMNPYLGYAAMLMAGVDGIKRKIDPGQPLDGNLDHMSPEELAKIHLLPTSLNKALNALKADSDYLLQGGVFSEELLENWIALKSKDVAEIRVRPTPYEYELYYET